VARVEEGRRVTTLLFRYVVRLYSTLFVGALAAALLIFLVGDVGDRWEMFLGKAAEDVFALYFNKTLVLVHQLSPVAMLLAAGVTVSVLRKRGEWLAMQSVGASRWVVLWPMALSAALIAAGVAAWGELVVTRAGPEVDRLMVQKFRLWGDYRFYYFPQTWFRVGRYVFHVRGGTDDAGAMRDVSVLVVDEHFRLQARYDAELFASQGGDGWHLTGVTGRRFLPSGEAPQVALPEMDLRVPGTTPETFALRVGRPELMRLGDLRRQQKVRRALGLSTERFQLAMHERFSFPFTAWVAALLAATLALRPGRRGHLTLTLVEGLGVTVTLFALLIVAKRLALAEHLPVAVAAWGATALPLLAVVALWKHADGRLRWPLRAAGHL
jgi:lipopolysaccharide export system permease protein